MKKTLDKSNLCIILYIWKQKAFKSIKERKKIMTRAQRREEYRKKFEAAWTAFYNNPNEEAMLKMAEEIDNLKDGFFNEKLEKGLTNDEFKRIFYAGRV